MSDLVCFWMFGAVWRFAFFASLLIEIASPRGASVHAYDRRRLSFFVLISGYLRFVGAIVLCLAFLLGLLCSRLS